ncbi:lava lamp [Musca autumnalis]|uniref:lava lamp n=1 Tax=Musca autumnalis TaxID=221902 RepID=UPI003CFA7712
MSSDPNEPLQQPADISNLQESFLQQQEKISALKELVRKSGAAHGSSKSAAQEKVKSIAERLMKSKAKSKQGLNVSTYSTEVTSHEASLGYEEKPSFLNISQASPMPSHASTPNPTPIKLHTSTSSTALSTPGSEKIALMRQQLEQNKLRMAQKASSKQHLEQLVSQLKEKFDSTQQCLENTSELGRSMSDLNHLIYTPTSRERHKSATDLTTQNFSLEKERIKFLENRCRLLEKQLEKERQSNNNRTSNQDAENKIQELEKMLADQQANFKEKETTLNEEIRRLQSLIEDSKSDGMNTGNQQPDDNEHTKLNEKIDELSKENARLLNEIEKLSEKRDQVHDNRETELLNEEITNLKEQLDTFRQRESADSSDLKSENEQLKSEVESQLNRIKELQEVNDILETARCDLASKATQLEEQVKELQANVIVLQEKLKRSEEKCQQLQTISDVTNSSGSIKPDTDSQVKAEMAKQIQELMDEIAVLRVDNTKLQQSISENEKLEINDTSIAEKIANLEATIESQREDLLKAQETLKKNEEELMEKTIELNVLNANFKVLEEKMETFQKAKPLFSTSTSAGQQENDKNDLEMENQQLKQKLDESNKAMIKLKLKCKQTEKQIEKLKKGSDLHGEVVRLGKEKEQLQQKITELEDEKGQWQLTQVEPSVTASSHDDILKEYEVKFATLSAALQEKEKQYETLKQGESTRVKSELTEIQFEEQIKELKDELNSLRNELEKKEKDLQAANEAIEVVKQQKDELDKKLEHYLNENIELLDKVEKLSKSSSSAESIEIVERLTQQEKQELEEFNKRLETGETSQSSDMSSHKDSVNELTQTEMNPEITESLNKLREESSELMSKIELFTNERREVLEKMEHLTCENHELLQRIEELTKDKSELESKLNTATKKQEDLLHRLESATKEKNTLAVQIAESKANKNQLSQELTSLQQSSEVVPALENGETLFEKCEKSLSKLSCELEAYRKANDKKSKFNASKKLAKEAENAHTQLSELLVKVKDASSAVETVTVVETVVAVTASNGKALAEYEQLTAQNRELKASNMELRRLLDEARYQSQEDANDSKPTIDRPADAEVSGNELEDKLKEAVQQNENYEQQLTELQSRVEDLSRELYESRTAESEQTEEITKLTEEIANLRKLSEDFDRVINDKEMAHEQQVEQLTRLRKQLESKCETYEQEMEILQTLVSEQKQQLIEAYKEHEHEMNEKLLALQQYEEQVRDLKQELAEMKQNSSLAGTELTRELQSECDKLKDALKINKNLVQEQLNELSNKQDTIDTLNQQIIDLYRTMEENSNKIIEKEDEIAELQEEINNNRELMQQLDLKLENSDKERQQLIQQLSLLKAQLSEVEHRYEEQSQQVQQLQAGHDQLEHRNKEQLEKLKKYAANLKKKALQCQEFENRLKEVQSQVCDNKELEELRTANENLMQQLDATKQQFNATSQQLVVKEEELVDLLNVRKTLEQEVRQLQLAIDEKESSIKQLQHIQSQPKFSADDLEEYEQLKQEHLLTQVELEDLRLKTQTAQQTIAKLQSELEAARQESSDWGDSSEVENLRLELHTAKNTITKLESQLGENAQTIGKLESELEAAKQDVSDWGDSGEVESLRLELHTAKNTITQLESYLAENDQLREELLCTQENLALKVQEIAELRQSVMSLELQRDMPDNAGDNKNYEQLSNELAEKNKKLEKLEAVVDELENHVATLTDKNDEFIQTIKKMTEELNAANNLKHAGDVEEITRLKHEFANQEQRLKEVSEELKAKSLKFEKSKAVIKERNGQIQRLQTQLKELQDKLSTMPEEEAITATNQTSVETVNNQSLKSELEALQEAYNQLNDKYNSEKANFQQTITRLETLHDGIQAKLQEDMSYIESLEQENSNFKEKIGRLQECVACFEERRASMERKANLMDAQLQSTSEEHAKAEDELIYRLNMLSEHDEVIAQRLIESQSEKEEMEENLRKLQTDHSELQGKYTKLEKEYGEFKEETSNEFETEMSALREQLAKVESDLERQKAVYDGKLASKATELDELECELNDQLQQANEEKREIAEKLERLTDECSDHQNEILRLQENLNALEQAKSELDREISWLRMQSENSQQDLYDLQELRMQSMQDKTEIENLRHQIETLSSNHESELQALRNQIAELDTLRMQVGQNQTDDQVFIETENKRLTDLLAEKEAIIENYQRQNLQLQMAAAATAAAANSNTNQADPFALAFGLPPQTNTSVSDNHEHERMVLELNEKNALISRLQQDLNILQAEFNTLLEANHDMQRQINEQQHEVASIQTLQSAHPSSNAEQQANDVIPAPPMFFTSDPTVRSPFDDIIQSQNNTSNQASAIEQPTIEDLQRNVSDLEKHAQDLEQKLATRNQKEAEYEDRLRELESRLQEKDLLLQETNAELKTIQEELSAKLVAEQNELSAVRQQIRELEVLTSQKDEELEKFRQVERERRDELHLKKTMHTLENQIVPDPSIQPTLDMFFGNSTQSQDFNPFVIPEVSTEPVVEEIIVPKKVRDCHPEETRHTPISVLDVGGDDWGGDSWGNEAAAEAEHFAMQSAAMTGASPASASLVPREQQLEIQNQELNERLQELQLSLERSEDQKKELHIKSGKLMKKLKEYKVKIDELQTSLNSSAFRKSSSIESGPSMFDDLDAAIQEEMKGQIKTLEAKLEEQAKQQEQFQIEREKLLKRIDVLTSGNERMAEMKERQDMEVQMYQARIRELQQKLQSLDDWGTDNVSDQPKVATEECSSATTLTQRPTSDIEDLQTKIKSLTTEIQDITGDRLELQALLEEEKANSERAEQTIESLRQRLAVLEVKATSNNETTHLNNLKIELQNLQESYNSLLDANKKIARDFEVQAETLSLSQANELRLTSELESLQKEVVNLRETLNNTKQSLIDLEAELASLKELKEKQLDAARHKPSEESNPELEQMRLNKQQLEEHVQRLSQEIETYKSKTSQMDQERQTFEEKLQNLQSENEQLKQKHIGGVSSDELSAQLQEKESEILHLKQRINDLMNEDQTEKLVLEILTKNQEIQMLKLQVKDLEEDKHELENNLSLQLTKEMQSKKEASTDVARERELAKQINDLLTEKKQMEEELQVLNNHVLESLHQEDKMKVLTLELDTKNVEILELRKTVEALQRNTGYNTGVSPDIEALNAQWQAVVEQRCGEIAKMWQDHLAQREQDFKTEEERLRAEINALRSNQSLEPVQQIVSVETTSSSTPASESTTASGTTSAEASHDGTPIRIRAKDNNTSVETLMEQMQRALESQEVEIVTLKEQLAIRSAEYARLAAQYDPFKLQNTMSHIGVVDKRKTTNTSDVTPVTKAELDLALYMLHQRDMRCEEMTLELVSLLEERDTLQLKLSNTLRQMEAMKAQLGASPDVTSSPEGISTIQLPKNQESSSSSLVAGSTQTTADDELSLKLSQLQTVSHAKDKVIKEEREQRIRQMEKFQQDVAKMPPAAVSELTGADMSQANQGAPNVLLNWLWGNKGGQSGSSQPDF